MDASGKKMSELIIKYGELTVRHIGLKEEGQTPKFVTLPHKFANSI